MCITMQYFIEIGQVVAEQPPFFDFSRWRPSAILDLLNVSLDNLRTVFGVLYQCANLVDICAVV